jgi:hypothetical protein
MKKLMTTLMLLGIVMISAQSASAQKMSKTFSIGFGLEGGIPTSAGYSGIGGLTIRGSYHLGPGFVTLTTGGLLWVKASLQVPVKAGYKFIFKNYLFAMAEVGYNSFRTYGVDAAGNVIAFSNSGAVFAPAVGVQFKSLELGLRYETLTFSAGSASMLGIRLGFNF